MALNIRACNSDDPYGATIAAFLAKEFPANLESKNQLLDVLTEAFVGSGQIRQGPAPTPEVMVTIRAAIKHWLDAGESIKVLVPWGSNKADGSGVDVAELGALRQLIALNERVKRYYQPGIHVNLGIEDMGGYFLWKDYPEMLNDSGAYVSQFVKLVNVLGHEWLEPVKESDLGDEGQFRIVANEMAQKLAIYLVMRMHPASKSGDVNEALLMAQELGWNGDVPVEMQDFYLRQYERYYPELDLGGRIDMLARYLGQSFARYATNTKLKYPRWGTNYVQVNFPQVVPGIPDQLAARRLYYRTLPMKFARTHMPAWRAKGFLSIKGGEVTPKLTTVHDVPAGIHPLKVELTDGRDTVTINADFVVED